MKSFKSLYLYVFSVLPGDFPGETCPNVLVIKSSWVFWFLTVGKWGSLKDWERRRSRVLWSWMLWIISSSSCPCVFSIKDFFRTYLLWFLFSGDYWRDFLLLLLRAWGDLPLCLEALGSSFLSLESIESMLVFCKWAANFVSLRFGKALELYGIESICLDGVHDLLLGAYISFLFLKGLGLPAGEWFFNLYCLAAADRLISASSSGKINKGFFLCLGTSIFVVSLLRLYGSNEFAAPLCCRKKFCSV